MNRVNRLLSFLAVLLLVLLLASPSPATCRQVVVKREVVVVQKEVVAAAVVAAVPVVPVVAQFALYGATYAPAPSYAAPAGYTPGAVAAPCTQQHSADILRALQLLNDRLDRLEGKAPLPPKQRGPMEKVPEHESGPMTDADRLAFVSALVGSDPARFVPLARQHCASCHESAISRSQGGGFTLLNGEQLAQISPEQVGRIIEQITLKKMPKRSP